MIKVYFETSSTATLVAVFDDQDTYEVCMEALEALALRQGYDIMTESIDESTNLEESLGD